MDLNCNPGLSLYITAMNTGVFASGLERLLLGGQGYYECGKCSPKVNTLNFAGVANSHALSVLIRPLHMLSIRHVSSCLMVVLG